MGAAWVLLERVGDLVFGMFKRLEFYRTALAVEDNASCNKRSRLTVVIGWLVPDVMRDVDRMTECGQDAGGG